MTRVPGGPKWSDAISNDVEPMLLIIEMLEMIHSGPSTRSCAAVNTHACVRTTAIDPYQRDLEVIIPREAIGSHDREHAAVSPRYMDGKIAAVMPVADAVARIAGGAQR